MNDNRNLNRAGGGSHWSLLVFDREGGEVGTSGEEESNGGEKDNNGNGDGGGGDNGNGKRRSANGRKTSKPPSSKENKPVFRAYDSLGHKNAICARELSAALEEHLIIDDDGEEEEEEGENGGDDDEAEARSRRLRQRRRLDTAAARTRSVAPSRVLNFVQGRCPRQGNASDCGIYILGEEAERGGGVGAGGNRKPK